MNGSNAGHVLSLGMISRSDEQRFWECVAFGDGCWNWHPGASGRNGYGNFSLRGNKLRAHRVAYALIHGDIPAGAVVMHICDNRLCVRPEHLVLGTQSDNVRDMVRKGRARGSHHRNESVCECGHGKKEHVLVGEHGSVAFHGCIQRITAARCTCRCFIPAALPIAA